MSIKDLIDTDVKEAMKVANKPLTIALRSIKSEAQSIALKKNSKDPTEDDFVDALNYCKKQSAESIEIYKNLPGPVAGDNFAAAYLLNDLCEKYLPQQMSDDDIIASIKSCISSSGASSMKDMGKVMGIFVSTNKKGTFDSKIVSEKIRSILQ